MLTAIIVIVILCGLGVAGYLIYKKVSAKSTPVVVPAPMPAPIMAKPTPPFPGCPFGPKPTDASGLVSYLSHYSSDLIVKAWYDWLVANPQDLDWVWSEYKITNP